ncbi:purple acid phosphatase family protein [Streptomyces sp. NPDC059477]|uniref:purple acid phosphatase family protein n=1 Tax=Streptomyces sp. NPDC059477 TaxID=3346847 RepID=UPI0036B6256A
METPDFGVPRHLAARLSMAEQHDYLRARLTRRRTLVTAGAVAGGLLTGCGGPPGGDGRSRTSPTARVPGSAVVPFGRHLALGADPRTGMRISWQVPAAVHRPYVRVGTRPDDLGEKIAAEVRTLDTPELKGVRAAVEQYYLHAALDDLLPGTTYYYGVGHDGHDPADAAQRATISGFRTAPATPGTFTFTAFGDQGVSEAAVAGGKVLLDLAPAFHLHAGDLCYADPNGRGTVKDAYDATQWDLFLRQNEPVSRSVPWMVTTGNHDMEAWYSADGYGGQFARFFLPGNGVDPRGAPGVYSFVHGNVGVVALDANDVSYEIPANLGYTDGRQTAWLGRRLKELRASDGVEFVVVFFHHCAYSTSSHGSDGGVRAEWVPLFAEHQVDLVINGHNHVYERTDAVKNGEVGRAVPIGGRTDPTRDGTVYVTAGGGGKELYGFPAGTPESYAGKVADAESVPTFHWTRSRLTRQERVTWSRVRYRGFSVLSVTAHAGPAPRLEVSALNQDGERVDTFEVRRGGRRPAAAGAQ